MIFENLTFASILLFGLLRIPAGRVLQHIERQLNEGQKIYCNNNMPAISGHNW